MFHWELGSPLTEAITVPNVFPVMVGFLEKSKKYERLRL